MDVFPRRNLPVPAEQWGREVERRVVSSEMGIEVLQQGLSGQNRNTASSLAVLSDQVNDLLGRLSYYESGTQSDSWTSTQPDFQPFGPVLGFTLSEPRVVSLSFLVSGTARIGSFGGFGSGYSSIVPELFLNGMRVGPTQPGLTVVLPGGDAVRSSEVTSALQARIIMSVGAGYHEFQGGFRVRQVIQTSGSGVVGFISTQNPQLYVDVAQQIGW